MNSFWGGTMMIIMATLKIVLESNCFTLAIEADLLKNAERGERSEPREAYAE